MTIHTTIFQQKNTTLLAILIGISALCTFVISRYVMTDELYYRSMGEQLTMDQIDQFLHAKPVCLAELPGAGRFTI